MVKASANTKSSGTPQKANSGKVVSFPRRNITTTGSSSSHSNRTSNSIADTFTDTGTAMTPGKEETSSFAVGTALVQAPLDQTSERPHIDENLLQIILSYVGENHYLYFGSVNRTFQKIYTSLFPKKETYIIASSNEMLQYCWDAFESFPTDSPYYEDDKTRLRNGLWESAIRYGKLETLQYFLDVILQSPPAQKKNCSTVGDGKSYCEDFHQYYSKDLGYDAAKYGQWEVLQWACRQNVGIDKNDYRVCHFALGYGHMDMFQFAVQSGFCYCDKIYVMTAYLAARKGRVIALQWLYEHQNSKFSFCHRTFFMKLSDNAAEYGQVEVLKWLYSIHKFNECPWNESFMYRACYHGHVEAITFLLDHGGCMDSKTCYFAALSGSVPILQLLRSRNCAWDEFVPAYAAAFGHVDLIEWAVNNGCPWSESTCHHAAAHRQLDTLKWLRTKGCPWDGMTARYASNAEIRDWAISNGCPVIRGYEQGPAFLPSRLDDYCYIVDKPINY